VSTRKPGCAIEEIYKLCKSEIKNVIKQKRNKQLAEINVVPYIDVMLVLLVIFMITAPLLSQGVDVNLPEARAKMLNQNKEPIVVSIDKGGNYYFNLAANPTAIIAENDLEKRITSELKQDPKRQVLVKGDREVDYGKVVQAMVLLQRSGAASIGLVTAPKVK